MSKSLEELSELAILYNNIENTIHSFMDESTIFNNFNISRKIIRGNPYRLDVNNMPLISINIEGGGVEQLNLGPSGTSIFSYVIEIRIIHSSSDLDFNNLDLMIATSLLYRYLFDHSVDLCKDNTSQAQLFTYNPVFSPFSQGAERKIIDDTTDYVERSYFTMEFRQVGKRGFKKR